MIRNEWHNFVRFIHALLKKYCDYRIESYKLIEKSIVEKSHKYNYIINDYNKKIELIIKKSQGESIPDSALIINTNLNSGQLYGVEKVNSRAMPLFVIDGAPLESQPNVNPDDIESITVLKDEAAIKIYGERGKDGVIVIKLSNKNSQ